jgi:predicted metal-dependent phosphoesterase TrpH
MGYHISAAMYQEGLREVTGEIHPFLFIAVEKVPPFLCAVYKVDDAAAQLGLDLFHHYARRLANCLHAGKWPGLDDNLDLPLPTWAYNNTELYEQLMEG